MHSSNCLNCETLLLGKYCHECGQKADTHRITAKHFIMHDLVHGVWHLDKGIFYTIKQVMIRPGYAAVEYIEGKRIKYYNIFYLLLLIIGLVILISKEDIFTAKNEIVVMDFLAKNIKFSFLTLIPMFALSSFIIFRRLRYNFFEHMFIAGFLMAAMYICLLLGVILGSIEHKHHIFYLINNTIGIACAFYPVVVYYQATKSMYKLTGFIYRIIGIYLFVIAQIVFAIWLLTFVLLRI